MNRTYSTPFLGCASAMITPFRDGAPDLFALGQMIDFQIGEGIDALLLCGTTGEAPCLAAEEVRTLVRFAKERIGSRVPLLVGTGANDTARSQTLSRAAEEEGADALLLVTPYYNKGNEDGLFSHFAAICSAVSLPVLLYDVPSRTANPLSFSLLDRLSSLPGIVGIKDAGGDMNRFLALRQRYGDRFSLYCGCDALNYPSLVCGASGLISVVSNVLPAQVKRLCTLVSEGDFGRALALSDALSPLASVLFSDVNPIPVKCLLSLLGFCREEYRLPLAPPKEELKKRLLPVYSSAAARSETI